MMTYYTLTLSDLATSTLDDLAAMEMGRPPLVVPWHSWVVEKDAGSDGMIPKESGWVAETVLVHVM